MSNGHRLRAISVGKLRGGLPSRGTIARSGLRAATPAAEARILAEIASRIEAGAEPLDPERPRAAGRRLHLLLDRSLSRWRRKAGTPVFELLAGILAREKAAPGLALHLSRDRPLPVVLLDRSRHLVVVEPRGRLVGLNRTALSAVGLSAAATLVATALVHGFRAAVRLRAGERYEPDPEAERDVRNVLLLLVGILGTEWEPGEVREELSAILAPDETFLGLFGKYAADLRGSLSRHPGTRLDDRVFRDGALFDRLPAREKRKVILAGTLAWYGVLTLGLLRLPRRWFARRNPYYETAWWIFRAKPGGRRLVKRALFRRAGRRFRSLHLLSAVEYLWASWNPILAETCLRPVYRAAGGNRRPFLATMATYAWTALVIHPLWVTLSITGVAAALGPVWPWLRTNTRIAGNENLILHAIVIGFWLSVGLVVGTSKLLRRALTASGSPRAGSSRSGAAPRRSP